MDFMTPYPLNKEQESNTLKSIYIRLGSWGPDRRHNHQAEGLKATIQAILKQRSTY